MHPNSKQHLQKGGLLSSIHSQPARVECFVSFLEWIHTQQRRNKAQIDEAAFSLFF